MLAEDASCRYYDHHIFNIGYGRTITTGISIQHQLFCSDNMRASLLMANRTAIYQTNGEGKSVVWRRRGGNIRPLHRGRMAPYERKVGATPVIGRNIRACARRLCGHLVRNKRTVVKAA
jgi:hypothetical protein